MEKRIVDVAVIGAGSAGLNVRRAALAKGASVLLIERGPYGTTCARVGCMPSKLLIAAAEKAHEMREAEAFGVFVEGEVQVDPQAVMKRVRTWRDRFAGGVVKSVNTYPDEDKLRGDARFVAPNRLLVAAEAGGEVEVEAGAIVIAAGSAPWVPPALRQLGDKLLFNHSLFELEDLPGSVLVVGAGVIGLELGQALHRLGVDITFVSVDDLIGPLSNPQMKAKAHELFSQELEIYQNISSLEASIDDQDKVTAQWMAADGTLHTKTVDRVLAATGRRPQLAGLGLEHTGLELGPNGVPIFDPFTMQCGTAPIFLAGDITGERALLHEASDEGQIAGRNAATYPEVEPGKRTAALSVVFSDPQIAIAGLSYSQLLAAQQEFVQASFDFAAQGRAKVMAQDRGLMTLYAAPKGQLLGAEIIGPRAEHLSHLLAWVIQLGLTVEEVLSLPFYHPVIEEGLRSALRNLRDALAKA